MRCPFDDSPLQVVNRSGVDIDWCPACKGVWLERGELDKLIDLATSAAPAPSAASRPVAPMPPPAAPSDDRRDDRSRDWDDDDDWDDRRRSGDGHRPKKRKNLLSEIFDF